LEINFPADPHTELSVKTIFLHPRLESCLGWKVEGCWSSAGKLKAVGALLETVGDMKTVGALLES
jgi:hypothetical protein